MESGASSGIEIRRILLLTRLRKAPNGMTMDQLVRDCAKVSGWISTRATLWDAVRDVLQSLIDDGMVVLRSRFLMTAKGRQYLEDPLRWNVNAPTSEPTSKVAEEKAFWASIHGVFDRAYRRLRSGSETEPATGSRASKSEN